VKTENYKMAELIAVAPVYSPQGYGARVWLANGAVHEMGRRVRTVMKHTMNYEGMNWQSYAKRLADSLYGKQYFPIVSGNYAYMTCQMVRSLISGDQTYGFIRIDVIDKVVARGEVGVLRLYDGREIVTVQQPRKIIQHMDRAIAEQYREFSRKQREEAAGVRDLLVGLQNAIQSGEAALQADGSAVGALYQSPELAYPLPLLRELYGASSQASLAHMIDYYKMKSAFELIQKVTDGFSQPCNNFTRMNKG